MNFVNAAGSYCRRFSSVLKSFELLYEDSHLIAVNKPFNRLSVPGIGEISLKTRLPRVEEWRSSVIAANHLVLCKSKLSLPSLIILKELAGADNVPRKENIFLKYLRNRYNKLPCSITANHSIDDVHNQLWSLISTIDMILHDTPVEKIPDVDRSVLTLLTEETQMRLYAVHRLDLETTGVLVFAKTSEVASKMGLLFQSRNVEKVYIAEVRGHIQDTFKVDVPISAIEHKPPYQQVDNKGRPAVTYGKLLARKIKESGDSSSIVLLKPITGRTHQLRVHMKYIGHPILDDYLYDDITIKQHTGATPTPLRLHAVGMRLMHPMTNTMLDIHATTCRFASITNDTLTNMFVDWQ